MITEMNIVTTDQLRLFERGLAAGLFTITITDDDKIVIFQRKFSPTTGQETEQECVASLEKSEFTNEIDNCNYRIKAVEAFIAANS